MAGKHLAVDHAGLQAPGAVAAPVKRPTFPGWIEDRAYAEGREDSINGKDFITDNPFPSTDERAYNSWRNGWFNATGGSPNTDAKVAQTHRLA